jgi:thiosulfate dehydrogenase [quinone] large subunit
MPSSARAPGSTAPQAYMLLRLAIGMSMFLHGATRIGSGPDKFAETVVREFQGTILPGGLVYLYAIVLPFVEGAIGFLLLLGWFTRVALLAGMVTMVSLIFGTGLRSDWNTLGLQLAYTVVYYILLLRLDDNCFAVDSRRPSAPGQ